MSETEQQHNAVGNHTTNMNTDTDISHLLHDNPPETVGGHLDDDDRIRQTIECAVEFYHNNLPDYMRDLITLKWGLSNEVIDNLQIGWNDDTNDVLGHLQREGFHPIEILRAGLGTSRLFKHIYECDPDDDSRCYHDFGEEYDALARARQNELISAADIDMYAVYDHYVAENRYLAIRDWWTNRVVFPYLNENNEVTYIIGRETHLTDDAPGKYLKQLKSKPYINTNAVYEPIYGLHTVRDGEALLMTEGITDAIMAHQHGYCCVSPVTKQFKKKHYEPLLEAAERAGLVVIVNDSEESGEGLKGALDTAMYLNRNDVPARLGILPRNDDESKVDLAEFLRVNSINQMNALLRPRSEKDPIGSIEPTEHPYYQELEEREQNRLGTQSYELEENVGVENVDPNSRKSAIFEARLSDVLEIKTGYRGVHPMGHYGDSENYFVVYEEAGKKMATDHKAGYTYTALSWLAVASGARSHRQPAGPLNDEETWEAWKFAKEQGYIPEDDSVPTRAIWHIARKHDIAPENLIPNSMEDERLSKTLYNKVLDKIQGEYGLDHGRTKLSLGAPKE